jgi:CheY-like chemotaxis protein
MSARILVVDDEPDLEALVLQKFRQQIRDGTISFLFAHDGVEALAALKANGGIDLVVTDINMPRMDGLALLQKLQESEEKHIDDCRFSLWRHGQYPHRDEPWCI